MISQTGNNLNILISCDYIPSHHWMAYLCWYSIKKTLPNAKVSICTIKNNYYNLFNWTKKVNVVFKRYKFCPEEAIQQKPLLIVPPHIVAIRDFEEAGINPSFSKDVISLDDTDWVKDAQTNEFCVFASYLNGWGNFVATEWINNSMCPLTILQKFSKANMSINEKRIEKMWNNCIPVFQEISGG